MKFTKMLDYECNQEQCHDRHGKAGGRGRATWLTRFARLERVVGFTIELAALRQSVYHEAEMLGGG
jgi:hypothetical protein